MLENSKARLDFGEHDGEGAVVPLDVAALVKCGQDHGECDAYTRMVLWAVYTSNVSYMLSTVACVVYTRMRCPPSLIVKAGCLSNQLLWVLNAKESVVLLTTFTLLVTEVGTLGLMRHARLALLCGPAPGSLRPSFFEPSFSALRLFLTPHPRT